MSLSLKTQISFWIGALLVFFAFIWIFNDVLTPFILGIAIAYLLNPILRLFDKVKVRRWISSMVILVLFIVFVTLVLVLITPPLYRELSDLVQKIPAYSDSLITTAMPYIEKIQEKIGGNGLDQFQTLLKDNAGKLFSAGTGIVAGIANSGQAFASFMTTMVLTPIVAFFMMKEWPKITVFIQGLYPEHSADTIKMLTSKIDKKIGGFVRGQLNIALLLGVIYALALSFAGLNYGFLIGICAGIAGIIPLVGSVLGLIVGVCVAWFQTGDIMFAGLIAGIFIIGQIIEGNVLTPKLLGDSVGLHPLWILFALMAGGSLFGITGMLISVPLAASAGVLIGFAIERYKDSKFYKSVI